MGQFAYEARTEDGQLVGGIISARDLQEAGQKLSEANYFVVKLGAADPVSGRSRSAAAVSKAKANRASVMWFFNQLAIMVETGIVLSEALECLARQTKDPAMKRILEGVCAAVQEGRPLSDAMDLYPRTFPVAVTAMIRAGEASGTLGMILTRCAQYLMKDHQMMRRFRGALMYPAFLFVLCIGITIFLLTVILPRFAMVYGTRGALLPTPTRVLMNLSDFLTGHLPFIAAGAAVIVVGFMAWLRTEGGRGLFHWIALKVPVIGNILHKLYQSRAFRSIGTLLEAGVSLGETLMLVRTMSTNVCYERMWKSVEESIQNGNRIAAPLAASPLISETLTQMIDCGDRTGRLGPIFARLGEFTEAEAEEAIKTGSQFIEPIMILVMGSIIGFVAIALLLPIFGAAQVVGQ